MAPGGVGTAPALAEVGASAGNRGVLASGDGVASVGGTHVVVVTGDSRVDTSGGGVAGTSVASIGGTGGGGVLASEGRIAGINSADVVVVADYGIGFALTSCGVAIRGIALVTTSDSIGSENTSSTVVASIGGASVVVVTNCSILITSDSGIATSGVAKVGRTASAYINVLATNSGRNQHRTGISSASIIIIASLDVCCSATSLTVTVANITPIVVSASDLDGGGEL